MSTFNGFKIGGDTEKKKNQMEASLANMDKAAADYNKMNYGSFVQGDDYKALSQRYQQNGQMAMKDTLGQMAARTGGMASSYANTASQQAYNGYMEKLEDAARSLYDSQRQEKMDALNVARSIYDRDTAAYQSSYANDYGEYRDAVGDQKWQAEQDYRAGQDAKADADARIESYIHNGSWQWGDWDNDGKVGNDDTDGQGSADEFFAGSSQGENYWKNIHDKYQEDAKIKGYTYQKTAEGAAGIVNKLVDSASFSLSENDRDNFDYIYGEGAYDAVQSFAGNIKQVQASPGDEEKIEEWYDGAIDFLLEKIPSLTTTQINALLSAINPEATKVYFDPDYFRQ